jgi:hypothetical protein
VRGDAEPLDDRGAPVTFCAICTDEVGPFSQRPLGRRNALVAVCSSCDSEPAREVRGPERGYEPESMLGISERVRKQKAPGPSIERATTLHEQRAGWITVRVPRRDASGHPIDRNAAWHSLQNRLAKYVTSNARYFVFQTPPTVSLGSDDNPLAAIEKFRVPNKKAGQ